MAREAGGSSLLTWIALGVGGYFVYEWLFAPTAAASPTTTPVVPAAPTPTATPATPTTPAFNSLDAIYARVQAAAGNAAQTPDQFNYILNQQLPSGMTAPDPSQVFTAAGFDRTQTMSVANWWGVVAPWLKTTYGLAGLGVFGGLGALAVRARRIA